MKAFFVLTIGAMSLMGSAALAQDAAKTFQAGQAAGGRQRSRENSCRFRTMSRCMAVFVLPKVAFMIQYENLIVVMNAGVPEKMQKNDGYVSLLNPDVFGSHDKMDRGKSERTDSESSAG